MASRYFTELKERRVSGGKKYSPPSGSMSSSLNEKTAAWPSLPGKSGPDRSGGVKKLKVCAKSEGL